MIRNVYTYIFFGNSLYRQSLL